MGCGGVRLRRWGLCIRRVRSSISPHQFAKSFAAPRQTRTHRADRHTEDLRDTLVIHTFKTYEQEYLTLLGRQPGKRTVELNQLPPRGGVMVATRVEDMCSTSTVAASRISRRTLLTY